MITYCLKLVDRKADRSVPVPYNMLVTKVMKSMAVFDGGCFEKDSYSWFCLMVWHGLLLSCTFHLSFVVKLSELDHILVLFVDMLPLYRFVFLINMSVKFYASLIGNARA